MEHDLDDLNVLLASILSTALKDLRAMWNTNEAVATNDLYMSAYNMFFNKDFRLILENQEFNIDQLLLFVFPEDDPYIFIEELKKELSYDAQFRGTT